MPELVVENVSNYPLPLNESEIKACLDSVSNTENQPFEYVEVVFVDEKRIVEINKEFLQRDYVTDIITFHYQDEAEPVEGTLYLCAQRIAEQANELNQPEKKEFTRVVVHGFLHLCGYDDQTSDEKQNMTHKEDHHLAVLTS